MTAPENPPATLGSLSVLPSAVSYYDGFFVSPTQILARATTSAGKGVTTPFNEGQKLDAYTVFEDISQVKPDVERELVISGGFLDNLASLSDPKAFMYVFAGIGFPNAPLLQARLGSVEEWKFINNNNDEHPIHIHVNDFQVTHYFDPTRGLETGPEMWGVDNANVPAPAMGAEESVIQPGALSLRMKFDDFTGLFVMHCHRLNHEDNGLMTLVNVIPAASTYAVAVPGSPGHAAEVKVYDGNGDRLVATVTPFPGYEGTTSVAMGDIDDDGVYDLVVGAGKDHAPEVVAYAGKAKDGKGRSRRNSPASRRSIQPRAAVSAWPPRRSTARPPTTSSSAPVLEFSSEVRVYRAKLPASPGTAPELFSSFSPYLDDRNGVSVASGFVDFTTGRYSIVTAPGVGSMAQVKVFNFSLMTPIDHKKRTGPGADQCEPGDNKPAVTNAFMPFGMGYRGGLSLATGWLAGSLGGAERIVVGQLTGPGEVKVYSSGSRLEGGPKIYLAAADHTPVANFAEIASFKPFDDASGVSVATTSTTSGADLLVSGISPADKSVQVLKFELVRPDPDAVRLDARQLSTVVSAAGTSALVLGGD